MAEVERFMRGCDQRTLIWAPCASTVGVEKGDHVLIFQGYAIPPSQLGSIYSSETVARREGSMIFAGVARNSSPVGKTTQVQVDISLDSIFAMAQCTAGAASVADLYGICAVSAATGLWGLEDQKVEPDCSYPIAVCVEEKTAAVGTRILTKLVPQKLFNPTHSYNICDGDSALSYAG